jgi:hypothetical protein
MYSMAWKVVGINFITVIFTLDYVERKEREKISSCLAWTKVIYTKYSKH